MEHYRLRKYRGPEVWARVRECYIAGESAPVLAKRFDVGLANIRKKARLEGWTRSHIAEQLDASLPPDLERRDQAGDAEPPAPVAPKQAVADATARASALLAQGRAGEAQALIRSAEALAKLAGVDPEADEPAETDEPAWDDTVARYDDFVLSKAKSLAYAMLADPPYGATAHHMWFLYHWRALHFGPKVVARDFAHAVDSGCAAKYFTADGALRPIPEPASPSDLMIRQHLRTCEWMEGAERLGEV
ncbi:hypothetical protein [Caulobacter sp. NIBR2454]|uniref:hypothetical protein n=1 Tax=Caulobacter sp. NIBR2454 TaxID=3015996 RepID=UPI0022B634C9|nr:hypothetical protein [Caulobacter sp. NIBR2454]